MPLEKTIIILGPTATGKTKFSIKLAEESNGEIISADSMQVYRGMDIGTAKPPLEERKNIPHHLIDIINPVKDRNRIIIIGHAAAQNKGHGTKKETIMAADEKIIFSMIGVGKTYLPNRKVLQKINLSFFYGAKIGIIGLNGSGKSTLLNILGCLDTPSNGDYFLDGISIKKMSKNERAHLRNLKIGFVFQSFNLLDRTSSLNNVMLPLQYNNQISASERKKNCPGKISGCWASRQNGELSFSIIRW